MIESTEMYLDPTCQNEEAAATTIEEPTKVTKRKKKHRHKKTPRVYNIKSSESSPYDRETLEAISSLESVDIGQLEDPNIYLNAEDIADMTDSHKTLFIRGNHTHRLYLEDAYQKPSMAINEVVYYQFGLGETTLFVESQINITVKQT